MLLTTLSTANDQAATFLIPEQKPEQTSASRRSLKESIGEQMKKTLDQCAAVNESIGTLQIELASIQKKVFSNVELLIDNQPPYKKATKQELAKTLAMLKKVSQQLQAHARTTSQLRVAMHQDKLLAHRETA